MNAQKTEKKLVSRAVAIALGIVCVVLATALIGVIVGYVLVVDEKETFILFLKDEVYELNQTINLNKWDSWIDHHTIINEAGNYTSWTFSASYAGYVTVRIDYANTTSTYVRLIYSTTLLHSVKYDHQIDLGGTGEEASFPILPSAAIEVRIGNNQPVTAVESVTITYCY